MHLSNLVGDAGFEDVYLVVDAGFEDAYLVEDAGFEDVYLVVDAAFEDASIKPCRDAGFEGCVPCSGCRF